MFISSLYFYTMEEVYPIRCLQEDEDVLEGFKRETTETVDEGVHSRKEIFW